MRYRIAYDEPGRLRVRFGPDAFTQEQGYGIAALLLGRPAACPPSAPSGMTTKRACPLRVGQTGVAPEPPALAGGTAALDKGRPFALQ